MSLVRRFASWLPTINKAITAGGGAAIAVLWKASQTPQGVGLSDLELAIGAFVVVGFLAWLFPNKAA